MFCPGGNESPGEHRGRRRLGALVSCPFVISGNVRTVNDRRLGRGEYGEGVYWQVESVSSRHERHRHADITDRTCHRRRFLVCTQSCWPLSRTNSSIVSPSGRFSRPSFSDATPHLPVDGGRGRPRDVPLGLRGPDQSRRSLSWKAGCARVPPAGRLANGWRSWTIPR